MNGSSLKTSAAIATIAALVFALSACGDSGSDDSTGQSATQAPSHYEGGEESIEEFGSEAEGAEKAAILAAKQRYLTALAQEDFQGACSALSAQARRSLSEFIPGAGPESCAATMPRLLSPRAPVTARSHAAGEVAKVRVQGEQAFVIFRAPGAKLYVFTMVKEGEEWKAGGLGASVLVPSAAITGAG